jgi:Flp pilus assembly protein TadG
MAMSRAILEPLVIQKAIRRFLVEDEGSALVEFTIFAPMLVIMSIYAMDFGLLFFNKLEMQNAAQAGAQWAIANGVYNGSRIAEVATNATKLPASQITVTSNEFCGCPSTTAVALEDPTKPSGPCSGGATCSGGALAGNYVTVSANPTTAYKSFVAYGLFSVSKPVNGSATVRIQ